MLDKKLASRSLLHFFTLKLTIYANKNLTNENTMRIHAIYISID